VAAAAQAKLGHDFSSVRLHDDGAAHAAAAAIGADAYTIGSSIFLGSRISESTEHGQRVLAHELVHIAQQAGARPSSTPTIEDDDGPAEREARELAIHSTSPRRPSRLGRQAVQRQPTCSVLEPENCPVYEDWIAQFAAIGTFTARDTVPVLDPRTGRPRVDPHTGTPAPPVTTGFQVLGPAAATHDPTRPAAQQPITPRGGGRGAPVAERFIDRPTDDWVRHNLPPELQVMAYQLPADCADIAVVLRHVWLFAHGRSEEYRGWRVGVVTGGTQAQRAVEINRVISWVVSAYNVNEMVNAYTGANGQPIRSFNALAPLLHPGDILVWEHHIPSQRAPTGGHTQTIERVVRDEHTGRVTQVVCLQGNQPIFKPQAEAILRDVGPRAGTSADELRAAPGRRIERMALSGALLSDSNGVWTWPARPTDPQHEFTTLTVAGPPQTVRRPSQGAAGTPLLGRPSDWIAALRSADIVNLQPRFEGALYSARAAVEGGASVLGTGSFGDPEADGLGIAAGERLWSLNRQRPTNLGDATHYRLLYELRAVIRSIGGLARGTATRLGIIFSRIDDAFNLGARGATTIDFTRGSRRGRGRLLNILLTGFDPFAGAAPPAPRQWNPSGAAVMQLDGTEVGLGGGAAAAVEGVVLPVSFNDFRGTSTTQGIVERVIGPQVANVDGVITVSENPNIDPRYEQETRGLAAPLQIEQHAAGIHQLQQIQVHPLLPPETATGLERIPPSPMGGGRVAAGPSGPPIITTGADVAGIARETARGGPRAAQVTIGDWVDVGFATDALATAVLSALGVSRPATSFPRQTMTPAAASGGRQPSSRLVSVVRLTGQQVALVSATARWAAGADISFTLGSHKFDATVLAGPGGDFLSNEIAYRTQRLLGASASPRAPQSFHVHTPSGGTVGVTSGASLAHARTRLANLVTNLRGIIAAFGRRLLARSTAAQPPSTSTSTTRSP
jgi:hypothetical protein